MNGVIKPAEATAEEVANYIIKFAHDHQGFISNLKLQKLLYYAQGWHLAIYKKRLFDDDIEAWIHGPAIREIYRKYKKYSYHNIDEEVEEYPEFSPKIKEFLDELLDEYFPLDAYQLERMTHKEEPWLKARNGLPVDAPSDVKLDINDMDIYFTNLLKNGEKEEKN